MQVINTDGEVIYQPQTGDWQSMTEPLHTSYTKRKPKFKQFLHGDRVMYDMDENPLHGGKIYSIPVVCDLPDFSRYIFIEYDTKKVGITDEYGSFVAKPQFKAIYRSGEMSDSVLNEKYYQFSKDGYIFCFGYDDNYLIDKNGKVVFKMSELEP